MSSAFEDDVELPAEKEKNKSPFIRVILEFSVALVFFSALSTALTWPAMSHPSEILLGGGELGGWLWRHWWHFEEVKALYHEDVGFLSSLEAMIGLGRFPETGNILDVLLLSYPLRIWAGFPADHNFKIFIILVGNGLSAYALARSFTDSPAVALGVSCIAIINPLVIQDINKLGLRQVTLWWLFLFPIFLNRAGRTGTVFDAVLSGILFTLCAAFYWFYGLFAGMFAVIWFIHWLWKDKPPRSIIIRFLSFMGTTAMIGCMFFLLPYFSAGSQGDGGRGGSEALPELTFMLPYPAYDTIASAPQRPTNYQENVLSSLHRGIDSSWPADFILDPRHRELQAADATSIGCFFNG